MSLLSAESKQIIHATLGKIYSLGNCKDLSGSRFVYYFLNDIFIFTDDIDFISYADDNTINCADGSIDDVILSLQNPAKNLITK